MSITLKFEYKKYLDYLYRLIKKVNIGIILFTALVLHAFIMSTPDTYVFDETYYLPSAIDALHGVAANAEHTPLSKMFYALAIAAFGNYWFAWRIVPILCSIGIVYCVYLIAKKFMLPKYALFAAAFAVFDIFLFVNTSIAILDPPALFFGLLGIYLWIDRKYYYGSACLGVAFLCYEVTLLFVPVVLVYELWTRVEKKKIRVKLFNKKALKILVISAIIWLVIALGGVQLYVSAYHPSSSSVTYISITKDVVLNSTGQAVTTITNTSNSTVPHPITNAIQDLWWSLTYYRSLAPAINTTAANFRPPITWILPLTNAFNPPQYFGVKVTVGASLMETVSYASMITYPITIIVLATLCLCFYLLLKKNKTEDDKDRKFSKLYLTWLGVTYAPWLIFGTFVQRMTFNYYFLYTIPVTYLGLVFTFSKLPMTESTKTKALLIYLVIVMLWFLYYFPINLFRA